MNPDFEKILQHNSERLRRICKGYCQNPSDQSDLFQEMSINIWKNLKSFRGDANINTWIYRVAINTALMYQRKNTKGIHLTSELNQTNVPVDHSFTTTGESKQEDEVEQLYKAINQLKETDRLIIMMVLEGEKYNQIAENLGLSPSNVGVKINRIKKSLSDRLSSSKN